LKKFAPTYAEHLARYAFALHFCYKRNVLDVGCNDGSGSQLLSLSADRMTVADIDQRSLNAAKGKSFECLTDFVPCDFEHDFPDGRWDTIVGFEIIEHLEQTDRFVRNIADHLTDGGVFVFSVPHMVANPQHKTLFDEEKIRALITRHLTLDALYVQDAECISGKPMYKGLKCYVGVAHR